ncbi:MAG: molybdopterin-synthase adenylyltransferase MoeB [Gemmatimonadaceae bacterium]
MTENKLELSPAQLARYSRHLTLPEVGLDGQLALKHAKVIVLGAGGLGSPAALYLAAAGVGTLGIVDDDVVDVSNLQRQILHTTQSIGHGKAASGSRRLAELNPEVRLVTHAQRLTSSNAMELLSPFDIVVDGTDNFETRYLVNDACILLGKPYVYASVLRFEGRATVFGLQDGPCYRCLFPEPPLPGAVPSCSEAGVLGVLPGLLGTIQATEALKQILHLGESLSGRLLVVDALRMRFREFAVRRDPACVACGVRTLKALPDYATWCAKAPMVINGVRQLEPRAVHEKRERGDDIDLIDVREPWESGIARIEGARLIPLGTFEDLISTLRSDREVVIYCHHGQRSQRAAERLVQAGFGNVSNLAGGIERWRIDVDPTLVAY